MGSMYRGFDLNLQAPNPGDDLNHHRNIPNMSGFMLAAAADAVNPAASPMVPCDYFDGVFDYIKQMLLEEDDLEHRPCMFQDCSALQACEKYFHDALSDRHGGDASVPVVEDRPAFRSSSSPGNDGDDDSSGFAQWSIFDTAQLELGPSMGAPPTFLDDVDGLMLESPGGHFCSLSGGNNGAGDVVRQDLDNLESIITDNCITPCVEFGQRGHGRNKDKDSNNDPKGKKNRDREADDDRGGYTAEGRSTKQLATFADDEVAPEATEKYEKYDKAFLCEKMNPGFYKEDPEFDLSGDEVETKYKKLPEVKRGRPKGTTKKKPAAPRNTNVVKEVVDLQSLLTRCASAASSFNNAAAQELLAKIRQHSSPYGDAHERLAHCFANALEARLAGTGSMMYAASASRRMPASTLVKAYQTYVTACPFKRMSNIFANKTIARHTREADKIHIIDFGILYGFQWPCIIQGVSLRPGGPPTLRITGIDFPQPGLKPEERIQQTGRRLKNYCKRFNVPVEFKAIAKKWDEVNIDDLDLKPDEMLVANCLYRLRHASDEAGGANNESPRNEVLKLIHKIKPHIFVHGVVNATYNAPFFTTRFKEALYHYSSFFDMMEATLPREDEDRLMYEREVFGRDVMNVIACEGSERVDRPESYKQWQVRNRRAGFRPVALNREIVEEVKIKVKKGYQGDFMVEEDGEWMLQGWKGRALYGLSCWKPLDK